MAGRQTAVEELIIGYVSRYINDVRGNRAGIFWPNLIILGAPFFVLKLVLVCWT